MILQGDNNKIITGGSGFNDVLWRAVDFLKDKGFAIDKIDLLPAPVPENPYLSVRTQIYQIYMSRGEYVVYLMVESRFFTFIASVS